MATRQIPNLPAAIALNGMEQIEAVQAGTSVRITTGQLTELIPEGPPGPQGPAGPQGDPGPAGPEGPSGNASNVNTVADFEASSFAAVVDSVNILGYYSIGTGALQVRRVASEPTHPWKFRSTDRYLPNGSTDNTNGGWWEGYLQPGFYTEIECFGGVADGVTDTLPAIYAFQGYCQRNWPPLSATGFERIRINFRTGSYYFSGAIQIVTPMHIAGSGCGLEGTYGGTEWLFPSESGGIVFNRFNTYGNTTCAPYQYGVGADGTRIEGVLLRPSSRSSRGLIPYAHGIWARCRVEIVDCQVRDFSHTNILIRAAAGYGGDDEGNANSWFLMNCYAGFAGAYSIHIEGADTNAGTSINCQTANAPFGLADDSFLGNSHITPQNAYAGLYSQGIGGFNIACVVCYNGYRYAIIQGVYDPPQIALAQVTRPTGTTADNAVWYYLDGDGSVTESSYLPMWGRVISNSTGLVYDVIAGQEASMWTSDPATSPAVWGTGSAPTPGIFYLGWELSSQMATGTGPYVNYNNQPVICGPYIMAAPYRIANLNSRSIIVYPYTEGEVGIPASHVICATGGWISGFLGTDRFSSVPFWTNQSGLQAYTGSSAAILGGNLSNGDILSWNEGGTWRLVRGNGDSAITLQNAYVLCQFIGPSTTTGIPPYSMVIPNARTERLYLKEIYYGSWTQIRSGVGAPNTGAWSKGDFVFKSDPASGASELGWRCITSGSPGTWEAVYPSPYPNLGVTTYGGLPAANSVPNGTTAIITDCNSTTLGGTAAAGGSSRVRVNSDGTNWLIG